MIREDDSYIVHFLEEFIKNDWGIPRWAALEALCRLNNGAADEILKKVILGNYPPRNLSHQDDLRIIERYRGMGFVEMVLHSLD